MENSQITETELWAYISKTANTATIHKIELWINSVEYDEELFTKITAIYSHTVKQNPSVETAKNRFFNTVRTPKKQKSSTWKNVFKYAAIIVVIISGAYTYQQLSKNTNQVIVTTSFGELKKIDLSDGSTVWLNASSQLSYNVKTPRTLYLEGEAFFEVAKDKAHPFTVSTSDHIKVKALGTSFNVKSYLENPITETTLLTGKVEVTSDKHFEEKILMIPNDKVTFFRNSNEVVKFNMLKSEEDIAWREGKIQFKNKPFKEIANDFYIQFHVKITFENKQIANSKFTGLFNKTTPVNEILEILKISKDFNYHLNTETNEWIIK
ncbi:FecR family protein [Tenacibaculum adriaticum]|uniref:FecR family protein n=1 Tax=Tenacibaculum adriaticum TaxID=413713 RepID=A0A5S5DQJ2_9FLAO|nr:FecR domain-containing protein [Tenacibaculum adriaticum]TYP98161.1 FecR family protein [Tenacibaculum adriaticum]